MVKEILITGGASGIGAELAKELSSEGNTVIICGRTFDKLKKISEFNSNIHFYVCDVSDEYNVKQMHYSLKREYKKIDVIINCAATQGEIGRIDETDTKNWMKTIEINLFGTYLIIKYFLELLLNSKTKKIINFAGGGAFNAFPNFSAYAVSKAGVVRLTENIAKELDSLGVKVNCVAPGFVKTDIHHQTISAGASKAGAEYFEFTKKKLNHGSVPISVPIECVKFLISSDSKSLTGKTISASYDKWDSMEFRKYIEDINKSDLFTLQRVNLRNLEEKYHKAQFYKELNRLYD
jgi:3-oxoacyl-[acyl-carrier protein] reductase